MSYRPRVARSNGDAPRRATRTVELHLGGGCELRGAPCACRGPASPSPERALVGGGGRVVLRGSSDPRRLAELAGRARAAGFDEIALVTHALATLRGDAAARLAGLGITGAIVPLFSERARVHDRLAGRALALPHALVGMRALAAAGLRVELEVPLLSPRLQGCAALVELAHAAVPSLASVRFHLPPLGLGPALAPPAWDEATDALLAAAARARALGVAVELRARDGVPVCVGARDGLVESYALEPPGRTVRGAGAIFSPACEGCAARERCPGVACATDTARGLTPLQAVPRVGPRGRAPEFTPEHRRAARHAAMIVLRPTVNCNQDCTFCSANETSGNVWTDPGELLRALSRAARRGVERVSFSGGEPTLSKDLPAFVEAARRLGVPKIELVTNGVLLDDPRRVRALTDAGLTHAFVSLHAHDERLSRALTQKEGDHGRTVRAVELLADAGVETVVNHVVTSRNAPYLERFVEFARGAFGGRVMISFALVTPQYKALEDLSVLPRISDVAPHLRRALRRAVALGQAVVVGSRQGIPPCFLGEFAAWSDALKLAHEAASEDAPQKQRGPGCDACLYARQCTGLWRPYVARYGLDELSPVAGPPLDDAELAAFHAWTAPMRWGAPLSFEGMPERLRDRAREEEPLAAGPPPDARHLPVLALARSRPVRIALVGTGRQARRLARALRGVEGLTLDAVASPHAPDADLGDFGGCGAFRHLDEAVDAVRPEALVIATSTDAHAELAHRAIELGLPSLLEKPLTRTPDEAARLVAAAEARPGVALLPVHNLVFSAGIEAVLARRELRHVEYARRVSPTSGDAVPSWSRAALFELLVHALSVVGDAVGGGACEVTRASWRGDASPEAASLSLAYAGGAADVSVDFLSARDETILTRRASPGGAVGARWGRAGHRARVELDGRAIEHGESGDDLSRLLGHFRDVVLGRAAPRLTAADGRDALLGALAAVAALESSGAPFDRPNAPRHVATARIAASPVARAAPGRSR